MTQRPKLGARLASLEGFWRIFMRSPADFRLLSIFQAHLSYGSAISRCRAITKFARANRLNNCAWFFAKPRYRVLR